MQTYRVYFLDAENHIFGVELIQAGTDDAAVAKAETLCSEKPDCTAVEPLGRCAATPP